MTDTVTPIPATPDDGAPDTGEPAADDLSQFLVPEAEEETEFVPGEDPEPLEAEGEETGEEEVKDPDPATPDDTKEKSDEKPVWTVTVNGKSFDVDEQELIRGYQLGQAATQKFQEASTMRKQAEQLVEALQKDPISILTNPKLGLDFRKIAEEYLVEQLKLEQADPATKAQLMAERKIREMEAERDALRKAQEEEQIARETEMWKQKIDEQYTKALSNGKVPKTPTVVKRMAELNSQLLEQGYDPSAEELVDMVRNEIVQAQKEIFGAATPEQAEELLGKKKLDEVRKADLAKAKAPSKAAQVKQFKPAPQPQGKKHYLSERELRAHVSKAIGGK